MERIMNQEYYLDHNMEGDAVKSQVDCASRDEVVQVINEMKTGIAAGPPDVSLELVAASGEI